jgi:hypothetical protein
MDIKVYVHATDVSGDISITVEQLSLLKYTGLMDAAKEVVLSTHYNEQNFQQLKQSLVNQKNITYKHFNEEYKPWFEYTTCLELKKDCRETKEEFCALYIHNKGSYTRTSSNFLWRKYLEYFCIERWRDCYEKLSEGYETCGAGYLREEENIPNYNFYAGNFFWAKSSYVNRCKDLKTPPEVDFKSQFEGQDNLRYDLEYWHGSGKPKYFDLHPGPDKRWYCLPETYRHDLK